MTAGGGSGSDADRIRALEARVAALEKALADQAEAGRVDPDFYHLLEDRFRGSLAEILERVRPYVTEIKAVLNDETVPAPSAAAVADLGCGRGELLQALAEAGVTAVGIEADPALAQGAADASGQPVETGDAIATLEARAEGSHAAIIALHLIEHLPFAHQMRLLKAAHHALVPGGMVILETPNPENLRVGAWTFHMDPTHLRPLPPDLLTLMAEHAGFTEIRMGRLHPEPGLERVAASRTLPHHATLLLFGPRDYVVMGRKPRSAL